MYSIAQYIKLYKN